MIPLSYDRPISQKGVRALMLNSFITKRQGLIYPKFVEIRDSFAKDDFAAALSTVPQLEEVGFDVEMPELSDFRDYRVDWSNKLYRLLISVTRSAYDFDLTGQTRRLIDAVAGRMANFPDLLFINRVRGATAIKSYESNRNGVGDVFFYSTNHDLGNGVLQSNLITGVTPTADFNLYNPVTMAQGLLIDFTKAVAALRDFKDDRGEPWHPIIAPEVGRLTILCSPLLQLPFEIAFSAEVINQTTNVFRGRVEIVSSNRLPITGAEAADWWLFYDPPQGSNRAFVYSRFRRISDDQIEDKLSLPTQEGEVNTHQSDMMNALRDWSAVEVISNLNRRGMDSDSDVIRNDRYLIGARWLGEIFPLMWQNTVKVDNAAS